MQRAVLLCPEEQLSVSFTQQHTSAHLHTDKHREPGRASWRQRAMWYRNPCPLISSSDNYVWRSFVPCSDKTLHKSLWNWHDGYLWRQLLPPSPFGPPISALLPVTQADVYNKQWHIWTISSITAPFQQTDHGHHPSPGFSPSGILTFRCIKFYHSTLAAPSDPVFQLMLTAGSEIKSKHWKVAWIQFLWKYRHIKMYKINK